MKINIKKIENGKIPEYKTSGSAGADCYARISEKVIVKPKTIETIPLGFAVEIPEGFEMQIRGRSGNARKDWVQVFNSPGTIDSDYRGEVGAILYNASDKDFEVNPGDRIAQAVIAPIFQAEWNEVENLSETERGERGFGSTGKNDKFYEPFKTLEEVESHLGKEVVIDHNIKARLVAVKMANSVIGKRLEIEFCSDYNQFIKMNSYEAFQRVKFVKENHSFGKEMEMVNENC